MTALFPLGRDGSPAADAPASVRDSVVRLGMPQLARSGLSEKWLLEFLGDRHWMMIAEAAGRDRPVFLDRAGDPVYAAFCSLSIRDAHLARASENQDLAVSSEIARVSRTQFASRHRLLTGAGEPVGTVELASVFVKRTAPGRNRSIARVAVDGLPPMPVRPAFTGLVPLARQVRAGTLAAHFGFPLDEAAPLGRHDTSPCPSLDFNGAGFLYFSSFQGFVDRAEWELFGDRYPDLTTVARDIVYHGNAEVGEHVTVEILSARHDEGRLAHRCRATANGRTLADIFTVRQVG